MDKSAIVTLVTPVPESDTINQYVNSSEVRRDVYCSVSSVSQSEWAAAGQNGFKAAYKLTIWADEYGGAAAAILDGLRYGIYRTYRKNGDELELYLERKVGA